MKILLVVQNYYPSIGGTQFLFQQLAERFVKTYGDSVQVFTTNSYYGPEKKHFKKIEVREEIINQVHVKRFAFKRFNVVWLFKILSRFKIKLPEIVNAHFFGPWSPALKKAIANCDADVILGGTSPYLYMQYPLYRHKLKIKKPFVFQGALHFGEDQNQNIIPPLVYAAIKKSEYYIANTVYEKKCLEKFNILKNKIVVAGLGTDIEKFEKGNKIIYRSELKIAENQILIGYIGRVEPTKNLEFLLQAFEYAAKDDSKICLVIAGFSNDKYQKKLQDKVDALKKKEVNVFLLNALTETEKINLLHAIDIFVNPSVNESFGLVFLEAWSCKKPVIGMSIGAIRAVIDQNINGLLANPGDVQSLAKCIKLLAEDTILRNKMGQAGYNKVKQHYRWETVVKIYKETLLNAKASLQVC